jgi:hypothetical protein
MRRSSAVLFVLLAPLLLAGCASGPAVVIGTADGPVTVAVEIADDSAERARGLMARDSLAPDAGMLFVFAQEQPVAFWMKNTRIPLDILYISADKRVIDIQTMPPCTADPCPAYPSKAPAMYALEVNAGFARQNGIRQGDTVTLPGPGQAPRAGPA